ncbi:MAG TPA: hypothetical protein DIW20_00790 [Rhodospirillaceae bacterium]|nr:hypothetical protein [Rhodospirillaceae bacterium]
MENHAEESPFVCHAPVIPAQAGIQVRVAPFVNQGLSALGWIPACAGMTQREGLASSLHAALYSFVRGLPAIPALYGFVRGRIHPSPRTRPAGAGW